MFTANTAAYAGGALHAGGAGLLAVDGGQLVATSRMAQTTAQTAWDGTTPTGSLMQQWPSGSTALNLTDCVFRANGASWLSPRGGAAALEYGVDATLRNVTFDANFVQQQTVLLTGMELGQEAGLQGFGAGDAGALFLGSDSNSVITLSDAGSTYSNNIASGAGGALAAPGAGTVMLSFVNSRFLSNSAMDGGGADLSSFVAASFAGVIFDSNVAENTGGALRLRGGGVTSLAGATLSRNAAGDIGGAIAVQNNHTVSLASCVLSGNRGGRGGGAFGVAAGLSSPVAQLASLSNISFAKCGRRRRVILHGVRHGGCTARLRRLLAGRQRCGQLRPRCGHAAGIAQRQRAGNLPQRRCAAACGDHV